MRFENNNGSALVMVSAVANFSQSNATFIRNSLATKGGAISLLGSSYMVIGQDTVMTFDSNSALYQGGAIYKQYLEPVSGIQYANCFVRYNNLAPLSPNLWDVKKFSFNGNVIGGGKPNAIHSTSVQPCISKGHNAPFCWRNWEYNSNQCDRDPRASEGHITTNTNEQLSYISSSNISAIPGWPMAIAELNIHDDLNNTVTDVTEVYLATVNSTPVSLSTLDNFVMVGKPNEKVLVHFESLGDRSVHIDVHVDLLACPPGFVDNGIQGARKCECWREREASNSVLKCQSGAGTGGTAVLMGNNWMGRVKEGGDYVIAPCPLHLCEVNNFVILPNNSNDLSNKICKKGRTGVLCGECKKRHCLSVNSWSYDCIPFNNNRKNLLAVSLVKYVAAVYLPYAAFLLIITAFHLKLTRGSLNGFVLFAQMITTTFDLTQHDSLPLKKSSRFFPKTYRFLYGAFNLNFVEKHIQRFCFSQDLNTLSVLLLNYLLFVIPVLVLCIAAVITKMSRRCTMKRDFETKGTDKGCNHSGYCVGFSKPLREIVILLLCTVVLLSYTKLCTTSSQILHVKKLVSMNGTVYEDSRVFIAGQMSADNGYVNYQIPAVLCGIYLSTLALLFLDYPLNLVEFLAKKIRLLRAVFPSAFIRDFTHEFQSCYRPKFKFFAAVYFIFRFVASLIFISGYSSMNRYIILEVSCIVVMLLLVVCKPYKENAHNVIDIFIFANLAIINALNYYQNSYFQLTEKKQASNFVFSIQYMLSMVPITCFSFCACMKLAVRRGSIRRQLQRLLLKVPNNQVQMLNNTLTPDAPPKSIDRGSENEKETSYTQPLSEKVRNELRAKENGLVETRPDIPVTIIGVCDKGMGEAATCQTSLSEGYYLKTEWSSERNNYGTLQDK